MKLRRFNGRGIEAFREALNICREDPKSDIPLGLLTDDELSGEVSPSITVEQRAFKTKREAAVYFHQLLSVARNKICSMIVGFGAGSHCYTSTSFVRDSLVAEKYAMTTPMCLNRQVVVTSIDIFFSHRGAS